MKLIVAALITISCGAFRFSRLRMSVDVDAVDNPIDAIPNIKKIELIDNSAPKYKVRLQSEVDAMKAIDLARNRNYYDATLPNLKQARRQLQNDPKKIKEINEKFYNFMEMGFDRRLASEYVSKGTFSPHASQLITPARITEEAFELDKTKEEKIREFKEKQLAQRQRYFRYIPFFLHKYIDYLISLKVQPKKSELERSLGFSAFFSIICWTNQNFRSAMMYFVIGNLITMSMLLQRGQPTAKLIPGMRNQVATWSSNAFYTASAITLLLSVPSALITYGFSSLVPFIKRGAAIRLGMTAGLFINAVFSNFFEVFEDKTRNGDRWERAMKGMHPEIDEILNRPVLDTNLESVYLFSYDPEVAESPYRPKYYDELPGAAPLSTSGDLDEKDSTDHFQKWRVEVKSSRLPPIERAAPDANWMGGKQGIGDKQAPGWLGRAFQKSIKKVTAWRTVTKPKYKIDYSEFDMIKTGPYGFRDKHPEWLDLFGREIYTEKTTVSRSLARSFGAYRKGMWKIDKDVKLQACDGADKDDNDKKKMK